MEDAERLAVEQTLSVTAVNDTNSTEPTCVSWAPVDHNLFLMANFLYLVAFVMPHTFPLSVLAMRSVLCGCFTLLAVWAGHFVCAPDILGWCLAFIGINVAHIGYGTWMAWPHRIRPELKEVYRKLFLPLRVGNRDFHQLSKAAEIHTLTEGQAYATENKTPTNTRLSLLLSGRLEVTCEGTHLHHIVPHQFIDSPEWESQRSSGEMPGANGSTDSSHTDSLSHAPDPDAVYQVSIVALEESAYVAWNVTTLSALLQSNTLLNAVIINLVGKDIAQKLYRINEQLGRSGGGVDMERRRSTVSLPVLRSGSVDTVHTGTRGLVRSQLWLGCNARRSSHGAPSEFRVLSPDRACEFRKIYGAPAPPLRLPSRLPTGAVGYKGVSLTPEMAARSHHLTRPR